MEVEKESSGDQSLWRDRDDNSLIAYTSDGLVTLNEKRLTRDDARTLAAHLIAEPAKDADALVKVRDAAERLLVLLEGRATQGFATIEGTGGAMAILRHLLKTTPPTDPALAMPAAAPNSDVCECGGEIASADRANASPIRECQNCGKIHDPALAMDGPDMLAQRQPTTEEAVKCGGCGVNDAMPDHSCPFKDEIHDDATTLCNCCESCQHECAQDV